MILLPGGVDDVEPLRGTRVAVVVLLEMNPELARLFCPPGRHDIQRDPAVTNVIDVGCLLRQQRRQMKCWPDRDHQLQFFRDRSERGGCGPGIERRRVHAFDVVEIELSDQRQTVANLLATSRQFADVFPRRLHALVVYVAQPSAKNGKPISVSHYATASFCADFWASASR